MHPGVGNTGSHLIYVLAVDSASAGVPMQLTGRDMMTTYLRF